MTLTAQLGRAFDTLISETSDLAMFRKVPTLMGEGLRRYYAQTPSTQRELLLYRDKWWTKEGGTVYLEASCLVPAVQMALKGVAQSLETPDYAQPFTTFQYRLSEKEPCEWQVRSAADIDASLQDIRSLLQRSVLPWLAQFESPSGVDSYLESTGRHHALALLRSAAHDRDGARSAMKAWLRTLPRQADHQLQELADVGLLSQSDLADLSRASMQSEEDYAKALAQCLGSAQH